MRCYLCGCHCVTEMRVWRWWLLVSPVSPGILSLHTRAQHCSQCGLCRPEQTNQRRDRQHWPIRGQQGVDHETIVNTDNIFNLQIFFLIPDKSWVCCFAVIPWTWCVLHSSSHVKFTLSIAILSPINKMKRFPLTTPCIIRLRVLTAR